MAARAVERMLTMTREVVMRMTRRTTTRSGGTRKEPQLEGVVLTVYRLHLNKLAPKKTKIKKSKINKNYLNYLDIFK